MRAAGGDPAGREIRVSLDIFQVGRVGINIYNLAKKLNSRRRAMEDYNKNISDQNLKLLAHRLLPEIRKYFADEKVQKEFQEWLKKKNENKDSNSDGQK
jgi:hypothetical protein